LSLKHTLAVSLLAAGWLCALSCSLVVDDVDQGCGPERKLCDGRCVEQTNAAYGCTPSDCAPCRLTNAIPRCENGACAVYACLFGFDCPEEATGCLTNILVDRDHCGHCDTACRDGQSCSDGVCMSAAGSAN